MAVFSNSIGFLDSNEASCIPKDERTRACKSSLCKACGCYRSEC